jgi:hypothetical protein
MKHNLLSIDYTGMLLNTSECTGVFHETKCSPMRSLQGRKEGGSVFLCVK